jgi:hypothetical protein
MIAPLDQPTRTLLGDLAEALAWRGGERPRAYGTRVAELAGMLRHAATTGQLGPLRTWLDTDAASTAAAPVGQPRRSRR